MGLCVCNPVPPAFKSNAEPIIMQHVVFRCYTWRADGRDTEQFDHANCGWLRTIADACIQGAPAET
jgi:hypothetical protein